MTQLYDDSSLRKNLADLPYAACITNPNLPDNPLVFVNDLFCDLTGYSVGNLIGKNCRLLQDVATDANEVARIRNAIKNGEEVASDILNRRANGTTFWNRLSIKPIRDSEGVMQRFTAILMHIETNPYETLLENQRQSDTALSELHHRLKNHLSLINSSVRLQMRESGENEGLLAVLNRIQSLQTLYAGMQQGIEAPAELAKVDLFAHLTAIGEAVTDLDDKVSFGFDVPRDPVEVNLDIATQLGMMVAELVTNAMRHAFDETGGEVIFLGRVGSGQIEITVSDNGQANSSAPPDPLDAGLGGKILHQMAKTLSATITIDRSATGMSVKLKLPASIQDEH